jgi:hypothetical protein
VPTLWVEVTQAWEVAAVVEASRVAVVLAAETFGQEVAVAWDSAMIHVKGAEDRATLVERKAWERVLRVEVESTVVLASAHEEVEGLVQKITLLEDELTEVRRAREVAEESSRGLSDAVANAERRWEVSKREHQEQFEELSAPPSFALSLFLSFGATIIYIHTHIYICKDTGKCVPLHPCAPVSPAAMSQGPGAQLDT